MQSAETFASEDEEEIATAAHEIRKAQKIKQLRPLNKDIIRSQHQYSKIILNAFQCLLQCQVNALIIEYNVKPHLYAIVGQVWFRFINQIWIKQGFGQKNDEKSDWIWHKNQNKFYQNNDFIEKWITPKRNVLDVLLTTEDESDSSDDNAAYSLNSPSPSAQRETPGILTSDSIDFASLYANTSNRAQAQNESISKMKTKKKAKKSKKKWTEKEKIKYEKLKRLRFRRRLPQSCQRYTQRINRHDPFGWKRTKRPKDKNCKSKFDECLYNKGEIDLELSLILLYISCRICGESLTLNDILIGAQKNVIPYLRAFESLPKEFRIKDSKQRRNMFVTDANYASFKHMFMPKEIKYEKKYFYVVCNLLVRDMQMFDKIVPFNPKLMIIKYLRDLNIPLAIYSIIEIIMEKYQKFGSIFTQRNEGIDNKWKELNEYGSIFVDYTKKTKLKKYDALFKMIFANGIDGDTEDLINCDVVDYAHLSVIDVMSLIVIGILCIYRFDKNLEHTLNENPVLNRRENDGKNDGIKFKKMPALKDWFDVTLKWKYCDINRMNDVEGMFGFDTMNQRKRGGLCNDNICWIMQLTQQFIERHYGVKKNATLIKKFMDRKNKLITKKYANLNKEFREQYERNLNEFKSFNSFSVMDKKYNIDIEEKMEECDGEIFEYYGYKEGENGNYSLLYEELMILCSARIGIKFEALQKRLEDILRKIVIVFEYDELSEEEKSNAPPLMPLNRLKSKRCGECRIWYGVDKIIECCNEEKKCDYVICRKCLLRMNEDEKYVQELFMRKQCGLLNKNMWKCSKCIR